MKIDSRTEFVSLSDSLTSPLPKPVHRKGSPKVVCIDSDTESDGSCTQVCNNKLKPVEKTSKFPLVSCHIPILNIEKANSEMDHGHGRSHNLDASLCGSSYQDCGKESKIPGDHGRTLHLDASSSGPSNPRQQKTSEMVDYNHSLNASPSWYLSPKFGKSLEMSHGHDYNHHILDSPVSGSSKPNFGKDSEMANGHGYKHILEVSPGESSSFELDNYKSSKRNHVNEGIIDVLKEEGIRGVLKDDSPQHIPSMSPMCELKSSFSFELKSQIGQKHAQAEVIANDTKVTHKTCFSLHSDGSDGSLSGWNDQVKGILRTNTFNPNDVYTEDVYGHKSDISPQDSEGERKLYASTMQKKRDGELSDSGDSVNDKRPKKSIERTKMLGDEIGKQNKEEKRVKDRDALEARKQKLKEEREILRREKQEEKKRQREEKKRQQEAKKQRSEEERKRKEELRAEATERRKMEKEKGKWEKGKFALQNITAFVDTQILEGGLVGGHLLTRFAEKGFKYHLVQNPVKKTVIWKMQFPFFDPKSMSQGDSQFQDSQELESSRTSQPQLSMESKPVSYVLIVLEAEEFVDMINKQVLDSHIKSLQKIYPGYTLCYLINKLMRYLHKREQQQFKNPGNSWIRPPVEQVLAKFITSYNGVHSRLCLDEAEVAEHIVGLTRSLAECPFKRKLSTLSLRANGDHVVKNDPNIDVIKKNLWMKALVALPKVSGACAIAIAKKYPSMNALFEAYLDPSKTVHEKEFLLQDLIKEGLLGGESNRRVGPACSRRVYRIMMAQQGNLHTDDVEEGADLFRD